MSPNKGVEFDAFQPHTAKGVPMYCIYLRKSRADLEAEARGEGETLSTGSG